MRCENATVCLDAFHLVKWVTDALDQVRRDSWNEARRAGMNTHARDLKHARYALWKNPEDLTAKQEAKLAWVARSTPASTAPTCSRSSSRPSSPSRAGAH